MKKELQKYTDKKLIVDIKEVKRPDKDAQLVAENIAAQLENRVSFRRAMKSCMGRSMKAGVKGIKTSVSGRLGGADMARTCLLYTSCSGNKPVCLKLNGFKLKVSSL